MFKAINFILLIFLTSIGYFCFADPHKIVEYYFLQKVDEKLIKELNIKPLDPSRLMRSIEDIAKQAKHKKFPYVLTKVATIYSQMGEHELAKMQLKEALSLVTQQSVTDDLSEQIQRELIFQTSYLNKGRLDPQLREQSKVILEADPNDFGLLNLVALDHFVNEQYQEALFIWENILSRDTNLTSKGKERIFQVMELAKNHLRIISEDQRSG